MGFVFVLGGARSGKSELAYRLARSSGREVTCLATAAPGDAEMAERIERHRRARPATWATVEVPLELLSAISGIHGDRFLLVDCLTLWVSNLLSAGCGSDEIISQGIEVADAMKPRYGVVVSNEVGLGIVPANALARTFRDTLGIVNATFAARAERSVLMVAGRAMELVTPA